MSNQLTIAFCLCQVCTGGPASRSSAGHGGQLLAANVGRNLSVAEPILSNAQQTHEHYKLEQYKCDDCGLLFAEKDNLWYHVRTTHLQGARFVCPYCQCTLASRGGLNQHVKHIHEKLARYQCETCGKGYSSRLNYYDHLAAHAGAKRNVCTICQKQFTFKHSLKLHVARHHPGCDLPAGAHSSYKFTGAQM